ncbi:divalent-cation tolerance protein CutA [Shewanella sp. UCD-KL12]|uniref:divalent-cation tolerance protein CutA n=1 Tax=Shewanella sp. UCD-KL12 TaxID=1917163 RepID=UPI0009714B64|nr:divalent-cation tolerance protein CutA [Shewanella sp. UCD-KL12]
MQNDLLLVITTCPSKEEATALAKRLIAANLAACIQIPSQVTSIYQWEGEVCEEQEYQLQIKCVAKHYAAIESAIKLGHSYQVPEIIALPISHGLPEYVNWVNEQA